MASNSTKPAQQAVIESIPFDSRLLLLPVIASETEPVLVRGERRQKYYVTLANNSCTCPKWLESNSLLAVDDPRRACSHIYEALHAHLNNIGRDNLYFEIEGCMGYEAKGVRQVEHYRIDGMNVFIAWESENPWMAIVAPKRHTPKKDPYTRYSFNVRENRWSFGEGPPKAAAVRSIINSRWKSGDFHPVSSVDIPSTPTVNVSTLQTPVGRLNSIQAKIIIVIFFGALIAFIGIFFAMTNTHRTPEEDNQTTARPAGTVQPETQPKPKSRKKR